MAASEAQAAVVLAMVRGMVLWRKAPRRDLHRWSAALRARGKRKLSGSSVADDAVAEGGILVAAEPEPGNRIGNFLAGIAWRWVRAQGVVSWNGHLYCFDLGSASCGFPLGFVA